MRSISYRPYLLMAFTVIALLTLPYSAIKIGRSSAVSVVGFLERWVGNGVELVSAPISYLRYWISSTPYQQQHQLRSRLRESELTLSAMVRENGYLREILEQEVLLDGLDAEMLAVEEKLQVYRRDRLELASRMAQMIPARVIYRASNSWENTLWIDVGLSTNQELGRPVVQLNSPVVVGEGLVGMVDYVGNRQSRVVLITDPSVVTSVRVIRGGASNLHLRREVEHLRQQIESEHPLYEQLKHFEEELAEGSQTLFLAKGELHGGNRVGWRASKGILRGEGFNSDTADEYGPARDLRSKTALVEQGDLLVTTGMDGVFPSGIQVARVNSVEMLKEGGYAYEIEARPVVSHLHDLDTIFVIPPLPFDQGDFPTSLW